MSVYIVLKPSPALFRLLILSAMGLLYACANVVAPTGGPRDEDPPQVVRSIPPNYSPNFQDDQIRIFFNEFVELRNIRQQLLVSPPLEGFPDIRIRGRSIRIHLDETLREQTTYNFFFGDAIRDITEGNAIPNFQFVFSTGDYVDSLSVRGQVINAYTLQPEDGVYVMMYDNIFDSVPYLERPVYLAKTDREGMWTISNMRGGEYLLFALRDNNANFLYDLPDEKIAFLDSLVRPEFVPGPQATEPEAEKGPDEALKKEGLPDPADGPDPADDTDPPEGPDPADGSDPEGAPEPAFYALRLFQEPDTVQRITYSGLVRLGLMRLTFRVPTDSVTMRDLRNDRDEAWYVPDMRPGKDTLDLWLHDPLQDSLFLEVADREQVLDTLRLRARPRPPRGRAAEEEPEIPPLEIQADGLRARTWPHYEPLALKASSPLASVDHEQIRLFESDTLPVPVYFHMEGENRRRLVIDSLMPQNTSYRLELLPGAFTDLYGAVNDSLLLTWRTSQADDYGKLIIDIQLPDTPSPFILQLTDRDLKTLQEKVITQDGKYTFSHLRPGSYRVRLIEDLNRNGKWDTGHYLKNRQPEPVYIFPEVMQIRQNWEMEEPWDLRTETEEYREMQAGTSRE